MKKFEIHIVENNLTDELKPIEKKHFQIVMLQNEALCDDVLPDILDEKWTEIRNYFLEQRRNIPFTPIRRDHEDKSKN